MRSDGIWLTCSLISYRPFWYIRIRKVKCVSLCLPEIQSAKLCIRLQFACHIRTCFQVKFSLDPDVATMSSGRRATQQVDRPKLRRGVGGQCVPTRTGGLCRASTKSQQLLQNKSKTMQSMSLFPPNHNEWSSSAQSVCTELELNPCQSARMRRLDQLSIL